MDFRIEARGRDYWASCGREAAFFIGRRLAYQGRVGLGTAAPGCPPPPILYSAPAYRARFGLWADLIAPTIACEGSSFTALNSYDRAGFSFGIGQFAAHVPQGDFVHYVRTLLTLPKARLYFPTLTLCAGYVHAVQPTGDPVPLENATSTRALQAWLNPDPAEIGPAEAQAAARLIHWTLHDPAAQAAQVTQMVTSFRRAITRATRHLPGRALTGAEACVIADLVHHGRAGGNLWPRVAAALNEAEPLARLLALGGARWASRVDRLRTEIVTRSALGRHVWDTTNRDFVARD